MISLPSCETCKYSKPDADSGPFTVFCEKHTRFKYIKDACGIYEEKQNTKVDPDKKSDSIKP
jgi:hypothetical protein